MPKYNHLIHAELKRDKRLIRLRDEIATQAMRALIRFNHAPEQDGTEVMDLKDTAEWAYRYADAMLRARKEDYNA